MFYMNKNRKKMKDWLVYRILVGRIVYVFKEQLLKRTGLVNDLPFFAITLQIYQQELYFDFQMTDFDENKRQALC